jgi:hypothetical protein
VHGYFVLTDTFRSYSFELSEDFEIPKGTTFPDIAEDILAEMAAKKAAAV